MDSTGILRKLQDFYTQHKIISIIFFCLFVTPPSFFYAFFSTMHLSNVFLTIPSNSQDTNNLVATTFHYIKVVVEFEGFAVLGISMFSLLTPLICILQSEKINPGMELSFKTLILILTKPARCLIVTWFMVRLFKLGYIFLGILVLNFNGPKQLELCAVPGSGTLILVVGGVLLFSYLSIFMNLALEISLREEKSGIEAFGKASHLTNGRLKLIGFLISLLLGVLSLVLFVGYEYLNTCSKLLEDSKRDIMLSIWNGIYMIEFYTWISFSLFYSKCKKTHGEANQAIFQFQGSLKRVLLKEPLTSGSAQIV